MILLHSSGTRGDILGLGYLYVTEPLSSFRGDGFLRSSVLDSSLLGPAFLRDQSISVGRRRTLLAINAKNTFDLLIQTVLTFLKASNLTEGKTFVVLVL